MNDLVTLDCLGVNVAQTTWDHVASFVFGAIAKREAKTVYFANAHTLNLAVTDPEFRDVLSRADLVLNDGVGLAIYARLARTTFQENFNGTDLLPRIFAEASARKQPLKVFLFGAKKGRAEKAAENILARYDTIEIVGTLDGYQREGVAEAISKASPDLLLVGMGNPLQEKWIDAQVREKKLEVGVVFGIGALIDFLSGEIYRAPKVVRAMRIEWLFRLAQEPTRLASRYLKGNPLFLARSVAHIARRKRPKG